MIKNLWSKTTVICGNHKTDFPKMSLKTGQQSMFYSCPKYYPENRNKEERACRNHVSCDDFEKILDILSKEMDNQMQFGTIPNLTNYTFKFKTIDVVVTEHTADKLIIKIFNKKALD